MKTALKVYIWSVYIVGFPVFVVFSLFVIIGSLIENIKDFKKLDFKNTIGAYVDGLKEGHAINMAKIDEIDDGCREEGI